MPTTDYTTIHVQQSDLDRLDAYARDQFGTDSVTYRATITALLNETQNDD